MDRLDRAREQIQDKTFTPRELKNIGLQINQDGTRRTGYQLLAFPDISFDNLIMLDPGFDTIDMKSREQLSKDATYANYIERQKRDVAAMRKDEAYVIPPDFQYEAMPGLSNELKTKLSKTRPGNLAQAGRIDGMTPAALSLLLARLRQFGKDKSA